MMTTDFGGSQFVSSNPNASCSASRWLTEEVFKLIDIVQRDEAIYNPRHKYYFCRPYVENFWREVDLKLEKNPGASLAKWTNLRISFRREYTNYLEEKVPPCWSYFDRMFFLHPYLRKKHQQSKSLDTQVQDALAHLSSLSSRMQRERSVAIPASSSGGGGGQPTPSAHQSPTVQPLDNYLDYFDEAEHNNSELEDIMEEEQQRNSRYHSQLDSNDIKSECEEPADEYEQETHEPDDDEQEDQDPHKMAPTSSSSSAQEAQRRYANQQPNTNRMHLGRLQMRAYHDEMRGAIRPRSQELQAPTAAVSGVNFTSQPAAHPNISFVRPTFSKPVDLVSTTTHSGGVPGMAGLSEAELPTPSTAALTTPTAPSSSGNASSSNSYLSQRHNGHSHGHAGHQQVPPSSLPLRLEANNPPTASVSNGGVELCDCKTDPDAMFLMSLLPDIQKLNGRDRGKIKIAFQNILQDYLYPD
ncbi:hypothetical protein KR084_007117 [Drosophila pseudotakahashii]|nr:hypothetical protein KR084_007117 [Drosophila pseudotakahashii]